MTRPVPSDPPEIEAALWEGWRGQLAWDVGANVGQSLWHLTTVFTQIHAFEPATESFTILEQAWGSDPRVTLTQAAVSDHEGTLVTAVRETSISHGELVVVADMPEQDRHLPSYAALPWGPERGRREVPCVTLDGLLESGRCVPDFVKVDTEGHEGQVLRGAGKLLAERRAGWLIEFHTAGNYAECKALLEAAGYEPETVRHPHYRRNMRLWSEHGWLRAKAPVTT